MNFFKHNFPQGHPQVCIYSTLAGPVWDQESLCCCLLTLSFWEIKPALTQIQMDTRTHKYYRAQREPTATCGCRSACHWPLGQVQPGTQTDKCGGAVTSRQLVVKGLYSICALIWQIVFSQASSAALFLGLSVTACLWLVFCQPIESLTNHRQQIRFVHLICLLYRQTTKNVLEFWILPPSNTTIGSILVFADSDISGWSLALYASPAHFFQSMRH